MTLADRLSSTHKAWIAATAFVVTGFSAGMVVSGWAAVPRRLAAVETDQQQLASDVAAVRSEVLTELVEIRNELSGLRKEREDYNCLARAERTGADWRDCFQD